MNIEWNWMGVILALLIVLAGILAYRADRDLIYRFSFEDLVLDGKTGKASLSKLGQFTALAISSWGFVYLTISGHLTEIYMTTYMGAWASTSLAHKWIDQQEKK